MTSFPDPLAVRAAATPDRTALLDHGSGSSRTYAELDGTVAELAARLVALDLEAGDRLGLLAPTSTRAIEAVHAGFRLGATVVPLNVRLSEPELGDRLDRLDLDALLCTAETATSVRDRADLAVASLDADGPRPVSDLPSGPLRSPPGSSNPWSLSDTSVILFTSGTTGNPKAVPLTAGNLVSSAVASAFRLGVLPTDRWLLPLPIYHMGGLAPILRSTLYGTGVVVQEGFDAAAVADATREHEVTGVSLVPTQLRRILDADATLADSLRFVLLGGAPAPPDLVEASLEREIPVHPTYGTTETASQVATATPAQAAEHEGTVGQPLVGTAVRIVDGEGETVPTGEVGEVVVVGPTVAPGYLGTDDGSLGPEGFHTGDLGHRDEAGRLWIVGRVDDLIVTGGETVAPREVESALEAHPAVTAAAVIGLADAEWGERVAALVVASEQVAADELREFCRERLAGYKLPRTVSFADELPRTASGTVDREAVRERLRDD